MIPAEVRDILTALLHKTRAADAHWQKPFLSGAGHAFIELGSYVLEIFQSRSGPIVVKLKNVDREDLLSFSIVRTDEEFELASELLELADPTTRDRWEMLDDVRRLVLQAGPVG